jgi:hypothetical protein
MDPDDDDEVCFFSESIKQNWVGKGKHFDSILSKVTFKSDSMNINYNSEKY